MNLSGNHIVLDSLLTQFLAVKDIDVGGIGGLKVLGLGLTKEVNNKIVSDASNPGRENDRSRCICPV
jgi:hypothetical protein